MWVATWPEVCLGIIGFFLAFILPTVVLIAVIRWKKIKLTPFVAHSGAGFIVFVTMLILLSADPRCRQWSWLNILVVAFAIGLFVFLFMALPDSLMHVMGLTTSTDIFIKKVNDALNSHQDKSDNGKEVNQTEVGSTRDGWSSK